VNTFPTVLARDLAAVLPEQRWLINGLWGADSVGIIGGEPKCCKSFLALGMAVSLASGRPCLDRFHVPRSGRVLLFAAEDALHVVRERLDGICAHLGLDLAGLDLWVITSPTIRLDRTEDRDRLANTVATVRPALLILDPFVRLHAVDENVSAAVAPLLGTLREIQRKEGCAVAVVHHARKGPAGTRAGQALRGSSEFHAWGDSNLYIQRSGDQLRLSIEHRAQPSCTGIPLCLHVAPPAVALVAPRAGSAGEETGRPATRDRSPQTPPQVRVVQALREIGHPARIRDLRSRCTIRSQTLCKILNDLVISGEALRSAEGWYLPQTASVVATGCGHRPTRQTSFPFPATRPP